MRKLTILIIVIVIVGSIFWGVAFKAKSLPFTYFGGMTMIKMECPCSGTTMVKVYDYRTMTYMPLVYVPGVSRLYEYYNIFGTYLLGSFTPSTGQCLMPGDPCVPYPTVGMMDALPGTGTSAL